MTESRFEIIGAATTRDMNEKLANPKIIKVISCSSHRVREQPAIICLVEKED